MKIRLFILLLIAMLGACGGIPLRSLPKLMTFQQEILAADPAQFMLAIQVDQRMVPPRGAVPTLELTIRPAKAGDFEAVNKKLPMQFTTESVNAPGLPTPQTGRQWLIYSLPPHSQTELTQLQSYFKETGSEKRKGLIGIGIAQAGMAAKDPVLADTHWESWLQISRRDGFFELWSGSIADLLKLADQAEAEQRSAPSRQP